MKTVVALTRLFELMCENPKMAVFSVLSGIAAMAMMTALAHAT